MNKIKCPMLVLLSCAVLVAGCERKAEVYQKPLTPVAVRLVEKSKGSDRLRYSANIQPHSKVNLNFKRGGYVRAIFQIKDIDKKNRNVQEGDWVAKNTVLARVRENDYEVKLSQANFQLAEAQAALKHADQDYDRADKLFESKSLTRPDYDAAKARKVAAAARVSGGAAVVREAQLALQDCALKAPMDGIVLKRNIEVGSLVGPETPAFILSDSTEVKVVFGVPDVVVRRLTWGDQMTVTAEAMRGKEFAGKITSLSPSADPQSRVFEVEVIIPNPGNQLKVGMVATVYLTEQGGPQPALAVPLNSVVRSKKDPKAYALFVVEEQGGKTLARLRDPVVLEEIYGNLISVTEGVKSGERVITLGATMVADGQQVRIIPQAKN
ncbi:MAG: efflux RND transporter periplasmic adaptor subunit [Deltaproteobacteria bacterium]|nr:efflux RND transporter periplasmic adaptor subunit [Deltaproteobacteria bacterium]